MKAVIDLFRNVVVQIATPFSTGTGFILKEQNLIITNCHVISGNKSAVVNGRNIPKQLCKVLYTDERYDLAFLESPKYQDGVPSVRLAEQEILEGEHVLAIGHPFGLRYTSTQGIISNVQHHYKDLRYLQHDAALNPGNSGGPLVNAKGEILGINTFIIQNGNSIGFSLPSSYLSETISEFRLGKGVGTRCSSCLNLVFHDTIEKNYCSHCGAKVVLPDQVNEYSPTGISKTIETILEQAGFNILLSRRGPFSWELEHNSATVHFTYHEPTGIIMGDAILAQLPKSNIRPIYEYLLKENFHLEGLSFSVREQDIMLSLMIFDRYLNPDSGSLLFKNLLEQADYYDNLLVEKFGALWKKDLDDY
jgi:serine protease Do